MDSAKKYSNELTRIEAATKTKRKSQSRKFNHSKKIDKTGVTTPEKVITVLPPEIKKENIIIENSEEYKQILEANKILLKQIEDETKAFVKHKEETDKLILEKEQKLQELLIKEEKSGGFFGKIFSFLNLFLGWG